jgi:hypothetical protein
VARDLGGGTLSYSIAGGADAGKFAIDASTGVLSFLTSPNYEAPTDVGGNNVYDVVVGVSDGTSTDTQTIAVTVTDVTIQLFDSTNTLIGSFNDLKQAVDVANIHSDTDFTIRIDDGTYSVGSSTVVIQKNISIEGAGTTATKLAAGFDTAIGEGAGNGRGMIVVETGNTLNLSDLTIDGEGYRIDQAIRVKGTANIERVRFEDIDYQAVGQSGSPYVGLGVSAREGAHVDIDASEFVNMGRIGAHFFGATRDRLQQCFHRQRCGQSSRLCRRGGSRRRHPRHQQYGHRQSRRGFL